MSEKRDKYSTFASSIGWNKGIHCFTLKQLDSKGYQFGIGVISSEGLSNVTNNEKENFFLYYDNKYACSYALDIGVRERVDNTRRVVHSANNGMGQIKALDNVTVMVDCDKWKIRFYQNDKMYAKAMNIASNKTYHAVITVWNGRAVSLRLIETTMNISEQNE